MTRFTKCSFHSKMNLKRIIAFAFISVCMILPRLSAQTLTWDGGVDGTGTVWSTFDENWKYGSNTVAWADNCDAVFNTAITQLTTSGTITCSSITVNDNVICKASTTTTPSLVGGALGEICTFNVANGKYFELGNTPVKSTTTIVKEGEGELVANTVNTTIEAVTVNAGILQALNTRSFGKTLTVNGGTITSNSSNKSTIWTTSIIIAGNITIGSGARLADTNTNHGLTFEATANGINLTDANRHIALAGSGTQTFKGKITSTTPSLGAITISATGQGKMVLQNTENDYTGGTTINSGILILGASEVLANAGALTLGGGKFQTGLVEGFSETIGTLTLTDSSTIALGTGIHTLTIANSSAKSWTAYKKLTITGWIGTAGTSGTAGKIIVGEGGLTAAQLAQINFSGYDSGAMLIDGGELVPVSISGISQLFGGDVVKVNKNGIVSNVEGSIQVMSYDGKIIVYQSVNEGQKINLKSGIYIVRIKTNDGIAVQKVVL